MNPYDPPINSSPCEESSVVDRIPMVRRLRRWIVLFNVLLLIGVAMFAFFLLWINSAPFDRGFRQKVAAFIFLPLAIVHLSAIVAELRIPLLFQHGPLRKSTDDSVWLLIVEHLLALIPIVGLWRVDRHLNSSSR